MSHINKKIPKRRFEEFNNADAWEQRKLNDMVKLENGYAFKSTYFSDVPSKTIVLTPGNVRIGGGFKNGKGRYYNEISELPHKFIFQPEDIFVTLTDLTPSAQMLGYPAVVPNDGIKYLHNQRLGKLTDFKGDKFFLFQLLSTDKYHKNIVATAIGTTVKHSSIQKILQYETSFPSLEEQKNIGTFFEKLDKTIALHQRKLEKIKALKAAYLSEVFPAKGEIKPKRRFAGFTDDWEQRKFEDCFKFPVSTNSLSRVMLNYDKGEVKNVHYGDVLIKYPCILNIKKEEIPYITGGRLEAYNSNLLENGDLIFADAAEDETVGKAVEVNGITNENLVSGLHTIVARATTQKAKYFLGYYINSDIYHRQLLRLMQGSKVSAISKGNLQKTDVSFPKDIEEQQKIGSYFKQLDDTITLHQRKLQKLQNIKKAYLNEMFI
ncbi:restriction endonuclease subunit S [Listeria monocytogenes]|nr:restriction endonuclease subunit S [Listeria monocytogenes]